MLAFLEKYNSLPQEIRDKVSTPATMSAIDDLEKKYGISLVATVMKIMTKDIDLNNVMQMYAELGIDEVAVLDLIGDLKEKVFGGAAEYLGLIKSVSKVRLSQNDQTEEMPKVALSKSSKNANFFFSPEDEHEILELSKEAGDVESQSKLKITERLERIMGKAQINFGSDELRNRFKQILETYLRGIRNKVEIKQAFTKSLESGGLGFDEQLADSIIVIADSSQEEETEVKIKPPIKIQTPDIEREAVASLKKIGARDFEYDLAKDLSRKKADIQKIDREVIIDTSHELAPPPPVKVVTSQKIKITKHEKTMLRQPEAKKEVIEPNVLIKSTARTIQNKDGKIKMEDVKQMPKTMSPIDELKYMDLTNFRRLAETPEVAVEKIKEKLMLLEDENYAKRLDGVKAWRISPVNKLYLDIGQKSISDNKAIDDIIKEQKNQNKESLTDQEFKVIMDLNRSLRF